MAELLTTGCILACSFGTDPAPFVALDVPGKPLLNGVLPAATILEFESFTNILPFGMCQSMANPLVIAATIEAMGVPTPMPCIPQPMTPWMPPAATVTFGGVPLATASSRCLCLWGGQVSVDVPVALGVTVDV